MRPAPCCPKRLLDQNEYAVPDDGRAALRVFRLVGDIVAVDALLENGRWLEHHHAPRRDWNFLAGLRITSDTLTFFTHHERAEGREFDRLAALQTVGDLLENQLDKRRRFRARQSYLLVDRLTQVRSCYCLTSHRPAHPRRTYLAGIIDDISLA